MMTTPDEDFVGKTFIVTGSTGGIGASIVTRLLELGSNVVAVARSRTVIEGADRLPGALHVLQADLGDPASADLVADKAISQFKQIDGLVNNAALLGRGQAHDVTLDSIDTTLRINLVTPILLMKRVVQHLRDRRARGSIVNVASIGGLVGIRDMLPYTASKGGIIAATRTIAIELAEEGIRCNAIAPGTINTPMGAVHGDDGRAKRIARIPMREYGEPEDVMEATIYLLSERSKYVTGSTLNVDGGYFAYGVG